MKETARQNWEEQANQMVEYSQNLASEKDGSQWLLGLYMARQWTEYLKDPSPDFAKVQLFILVLKAEKINHGSGWHDLCCRVEHWLNAIEKSND